MMNGGARVSDQNVQNYERGQLVESNVELMSLEEARFGTETDVEVYNKSICGISCM